MPDEAVKCRRCGGDLVQTGAGEWGHRGEVFGLAEPADHSAEPDGDPFGGAAWRGSREGHAAVERPSMTRLAGAGRRLL